MKSFVYKKFDYNKSFTYYTIYEIRYIFRPNKFCFKVWRAAY